MKKKTLRQIFTGCFAIMLVQPNITMAGEVEVCVTSQSGCHIAGNLSVRVEAGSPEFRDAISIALGVVKANQESCPDAHITIDSLVNHTSNGRENLCAGEVPPT